MEGQCTRDASTSLDPHTPLHQQPTLTEYLDQSVARVSEDDAERQEIEGAATEIAGIREGTKKFKKKKPPLCPRCAGKKITANTKPGKKSVCCDCGEHFDQPLQVTPCPKCGSSEAVGRKTWKTLPNGIVWVALICRACNIQFPLHRELRYKRYSFRVYAYVIYHLLKGMSLEDVRGGLKQFERVDVSVATLHNWVKQWIAPLAPYLLSLKLDTSGFIYLDEMLHRVEHRSKDGRKYTEDVWQWNSWDAGKKTRLAVRLARSRNTEIACQLILQTLQRIRMPKDGVTLWCDGLSSYKTAYQRLVELGRISPEKVKMFSTPKTEIYSVINEIEGVNMRWRHDVDQKLKIRDSLENAERKLQALIVMHDFIEPRKEFNGKTAALNANAEINFGANDTEALVRLSHTLKTETLRKFKVAPRREIRKRSRLLSSRPNDTIDLVSLFQGHKT
jgi:hypothetical protein